MFARNVGQPGIPGVFVRNEGISDTPRNVDLRIAPEDAVFVGGIVEVAAFVEELHVIRQGEKAVRKAHRDVDLILPLRRKKDTGPFSEMGGVEPDINCYVQGLALDDTAQLGLRMVQLVMEAAKSAFHRPRVVVLDESIPDAQPFKLCPVVGLKEEAARIAKDGRAKLANTGK